MSLKAIKGKIESQELNDNFSYLDSNKRGKNQDIQMGDLSQEVKEAMTGGSVAVVGPDSVGNINIKNEAVSVDKVDFIKHVLEGELTDTATYVKGNLGANNLNFVPVNPSFPDAETIVIPIKTGKMYTIEVSNSSNWTRTRAFIFNDYPNAMQKADRVIVNDDNYKDTIKFTNDGAEYLFLYLNHQGNKPSFTITEETNYLDKEKVEIMDRTITEDKTTFIKNMEKVYGAVDGEYLSGVIGKTSVNYRNNDFYPEAQVVVFPVDQNDKCKFKTTNTSKQTRLRIGIFNSYPRQGQTIDTVITMDDDVGSEVEFDVPGGSAYVMIYLNENGDIVPFELTVIKGKSVLDNKKVGIDENVIEPVNTTFFKYSKKNLFNKSIDLSGYIHGEVGESFAYFRDWQAVWPDAVTHVVKIDPNETYTIQVFGGNRRRFALATKFPEASIGNVENPEIKLIYNDGVDDVFTFTSDSNTQYLMLYLSSSGEDVKCQVEKGAIPTDYEPTAWIDDKYLRIINNDGDGGTGGKSEHFIVGNFNEVYTSPEMPDMSGGVLGGATITDVYDWYDEVMSANTDVMTKALLGYGHNSEGDIDEDLPIYEYEIKAAETTNVSQGGTNAELDKEPIMLFVAGVHGNEKAAVYGLYQTIKQMFENPNNSNAMEALLANFTFKIIPIVNPDGFNRNRRLNGRGVNINRNFSYQWEEFPVGEKGDEPYSENESKILRDWLIENSEAFAYLDFHNFNRNYSGRDRAMNSYNLTPNRDLDKMYSQMIRLLSKRWKKTYMKDHADTNGDIAYGFLLSNFYRQTPATINEAYHVTGIKLSATPESALQDPINTSTHYTSETLELTVEIYTNYIFSMIDRFGQ